MQNQDVHKIIDDCCDQFEADLRAGNSPDIADYLSQVDLPHRPQMLRELLVLELELLGPEKFVESAMRYRKEVLPEFDHVIEECLAAQTAGELHSLSLRPKSKHLVSADDTYMTIAQEDAAAKAAQEASQSVSSTKRMGNYKLLQVIGEGGMGSVWMAEQEKPVRRRVALKIIKAGLDSREVIARFEAERQALAMMDHPNIARILDAGTTEQGQPYFAMELVQGVPLTEYCDAHKLDLTQRLQLFTKVCDAVQHAHQKGIIHRDLKPSNILVAEYNGQPVPKVIDFGLAKALEATQKLTDKSLFTEFGQVLGTLKYMSPEQAGLDSLDIDTRSDIYALGVILYELLTGTTPLDSDSFKGQALLKVLELIREQESPRPSSRLATTKRETLAAVTEKRRTDAKRLGSVLLGDLDWIVMKALDKDRNRRYESANGFSQDIQHYLNSEPVTARPPSLGYKASKFVRKNQGLVTAASLILAAILLGLAGTIGFALDANNAKILANQEATKAKQNEQQAIDNRRDALNAIDDFFLTVSEVELLNAPGLQPLRLQLLAKATDYFEILLSDSQTQATSEVESLAIRLDAKIRYGRMLSAMGQIENSQRLFLEAVKEGKNLRISEDSPDSHFATVALGYLGLARSYEKQQDFARCEDTCKTGLEKYGQIKAFTNSKIAREVQIDLLLAYGFVLGQQGRIAQANEQLLNAKAKAESLPDNESDPQLLDRQADALHHLSDIANRSESIRLLQEAVEVRRKLKLFAPDNLRNRATLGDTLQTLAWQTRAENPQQSIEWFKEAAELQDALRLDSPTISDYRLASAKTADLHAYTLHQLGMRDTDSQTQNETFRDSLNLYAKAESILIDLKTATNEADSFENLSPSEKSLLAMIYNGQALVYRDLKDLDSAVDRFDLAFEVQSQLAQASPEIVSLQRDAMGTQHNLGRTYASFQEFAKAADACLKANDLLQQMVQTFPEAKMLLADLANTQSEANSALLMLGDLSRIESSYKPAAPMWKIAAEELEEAAAFAVPEYIARIDDCLFEAVRGNLEQVEAMVPEIIEGGQTNPEVFVKTANCIASIAESLTEKEPAPEKVINRLQEIGRDLLKRLEESGAASREEIEAEPRLKWLLSRAKS
jgi:serine/threonine protein kinase